MFWQRLGTSEERAILSCRQGIPSGELSKNWTSPCRNLAFIRSKVTDPVLFGALNNLRVTFFLSQDLATELGRPGAASDHQRFHQLLRINTHCGAIAPGNPGYQPLDGDGPPLGHRGLGGRRRRGHLPHFSRQTPRLICGLKTGQSLTNRNRVQTTPALPDEQLETLYTGLLQAFCALLNSPLNARADSHTHQQF